MKTITPRIETCRNVNALGSVPIPSNVRSNSENVFMFERSITGQDFQAVMLVSRSNQIRPVSEMRSFYRIVRMEDLWHEEAKRNIRLSKSGKPMTSRRVNKKRGVSSKEAERRAWATVNKSDKGGRKKGGGGRWKNEVNQVPARAEGKAAADRIVESTRQSRAGGRPARIVIRSLGEGQRISFRSGPFLSRNLGSLFAESCTRLFRQMRNRSLSPCSFGRFLNVPLRSGSLFSSCHNVPNQAVRGSRF